MDQQQARPSYIPLPPPVFSMSATTTALESPEALFFTPPGSPLVDAPLVTVSTDDAFPSSADPPDGDLGIDVDGLNTLEKIFVFSLSKAAFHRIFICHSLPTFLDNVPPREAVEYVLPLLDALAVDDDERVKEALVSELPAVIWWFFSHCQVISGMVEPSELAGDIPSISVQAFTPLMGTLLLSQNALVGGPARAAVVDLLQKMSRADSGSPISDLLDADLPIGRFGKPERALFQDEIFWQVVIGMGRLDEGDRGSHDNVAAVDIDDDSDGERDVFYTPSASAFAESTPLEQNINPYFPTMLPYGSVSSLSTGSSERSTPGSTTSTTASESSSAGSPSPSIDNPDISVANDGKRDSRASSKEEKLDVSLIRPSDSLSSLLATPPSNSGSAEGSPPISLTSSPTTSLELTPSRSRLYQLPSSDPGLASPANASPLAYSPRSASSPGIFVSPRDISPISAPSSSSSSLTASGDAESSSSSPSSAFVIPLATSPTEALQSNNNTAPLSPIGPEDSEISDVDQASVGRLTSMSLIGSVTSSIKLDPPILDAFVAELEGVSQDPVYWVRKEACFALGALAKVVPDEVVQLSLLPLFNNFLSDMHDQVRYSGLFALPPILSRLPRSQRKQLALRTLVPMSRDDSPDVRLRVFESLGEVIYTFHTQEEDEGGGPPQELIDMFLGVQNSSATFEDAVPQHLTLKSHPSRPLILAFNFPAVALVLGSEKWPYLLPTYLTLTKDSTFEVRRTLAASIGEMAKIIGSNNAETDLVNVWCRLAESEEDDVRIKIVESLLVFLQSLEDRGRGVVLRQLVHHWKQNLWRGWRERAAIAKCIVSFMSIVAQVPDSLHMVGELFSLVLRDPVSAVREIGVQALPDIWLNSKGEALDRLGADIDSLGKSNSYRQRMTFVACKQALLFPQGPLSAIVTPDATFWGSLHGAAVDPIVSIRIGVARLVGMYYQDLSPGKQHIPLELKLLVRQLSQDESNEVRSFVPDPSDSEVQPTCPPNHVGTTSQGRWGAAATFSRPPPPRIGNIDQTDPRLSA